MTFKVGDQVEWTTGVGGRLTGFVAEPDHGFGRLRVWCYEREAYLRPRNPRLITPARDQETAS